MQCSQCNRPARAKGLCQAHYQAERRNPAPAPEIGGLPTAAQEKRLIEEKYGDPGDTSRPREVPDPEPLTIPSPRRHKVWVEVFAPEPPKRNGQPYFRYPRLFYRCDCESVLAKHGPYEIIGDLEAAAARRHGV
jgi:hypothetical protein